MANVRNNHAGRLTVAGVPIRPGATVLIEGWSEDLASGTERALLDAKLIEVVGDGPKEPRKASKDDEPAKADAKAEKKA